ncbi:hypothetical protein KCU77_g2214, partial [Aureobasidium melanogenum]
MNTSRSLLVLPNELLAMIIRSGDLTTKDLANLRLVCKHTKHFASSNLGKRIFVDLNIWYTRDALNWFLNLLHSDMGNHVQSVSLAECRGLSEKFYPSKYYGLRDAEVNSEYYQLQNITIKRCNGPAHLWKKVICAATHLRTFKLVDTKAPYIGRFWLAVYSHTFDENDKLLSGVESDFLSSLELVNLHISAGVLKRLLDIHKETLSTVEIRDCILVDGNWLEVLNCIRLDLSHLRILCIDVRHEATKKVTAPEQDHRRSLDPTSYLEKSPYALTGHSTTLQLKLVGQKEIANRLPELLKARDGHQAQ